MASYAVDRMLEHLQSEGITLQFDPDWDGEECYNYIVHCFDIFIMLPAFQWLEESRRFMPNGSWNKKKVW